MGAEYFRKVRRKGGRGTNPFPGKGKNMKTWYLVVDGIFVKGYYKTLKEAQEHVELMATLGKSYTIEVYHEKI